jgi:DNA-binding transcriptional LysR family regulator
MELRPLRYALAVARTRSFTKAATRLHISQSAVSEQVAKLEAEIGFALFNRVGHGVEVTDGGRTFLAEAERVLGEVGSLARAAHRLRGRLVDTVAIGMGSGMAQIFIPRLFPAVSERAPELRLDVLTAPTKSIFQDLHDERIDLGIAIAANPERVPTGLVQEPLAELDLALVVHPRHRLAGRTRPVDLGAVMGEPMVMNELTVGYGEVVMSLFADLGVRPNIFAVADNIETMKVIVQQGKSAAIMPAAAVAREARAGLLRALPIAPARKIGLSLYRRREPTARKREGYLALITEVLKAPLTGR